MKSEFVENNQIEPEEAENSIRKDRPWRFLAIPAFIIGVALSILNHHDYGRETHLGHLQLFNTSSVQDSLADKFLVFYNSASNPVNDISIQLDFENERYKIKAPVISESILKDYGYTQEFESTARLISDSVFNSCPTDFVATDDHFNPIETFPMEMTFLLDSLIKLHRNDKYLSY